MDELDELLRDVTQAKESLTRAYYRLYSLPKDEKIASSLGRAKETVHDLWTAVALKIIGEEQDNGNGI